MGHVPHVYVAPPWSESTLPLSDATLHHLRRVLRRVDGAELSYTDGAGIAGVGRLVGERLARGEERLDPPVSCEVIVATAPPRKTDRSRFVVEKLAELGVDRLIWLATRHGEGRPPDSSKTGAWAVAALEQSRGSRLLSVEGPAPPGDIDRRGTLLVADPSGDTVDVVAGSPAPWIVLVGPEGGFAPHEVPGSAIPVTLGGRILRTETAAIVSAVLLRHLADGRTAQWTGA